MHAIEVTPVRGWWDRRAFLSLPWQLHQADPHWVPPLRRNQKELVGFARHPFYLRAQAQAFLARSQGKIVGRILAIDNAAWLARHSESKLGFVGFFESVDQVEVARGLFAAAAKWLANRGLETMRGPLNPSLNYEGGLLVQGFDTPPTFLMTYNPPYYPQLWEDCGFRKAQDLLTFLGHVEDLSVMGKKIFEVSQEAKRRFRIDLTPLRPKRFWEDVNAFLHIYNVSNEGNWGHIPLSQEEMRQLGKGLRHLIVPELTRIARIDGRAVGAVFCILDFNPIIRQINGRLFPFGFLKLLWNRKQLRRVRIVSTNVLPEYQRWGVGVVLAAGVVPPVLDWPCDEGEFSWVLESNDLSRKSLERGKLKVAKVHRIYDAPTHDR